jgi:hypothetical protein
MDLYETKDRIAVALAESIFRRARYQVQRAANEVTVRRFAREEFAPNFTVGIQGRDGVAREFPVDVTYRPFVEQFVALENQRRSASMMLLARRQWPGLRFVLVTDHPAPGRSCFQTVVFGPPGSEVLTTVNLADDEELAIFPHNVTDHEELLVRIVAMLSADRFRRDISRVG